MAIVKEIQTGSATVKIDDSCYNGMSREALAERWAEVRRAILQIDREEHKCGWDCMTATKQDSQTLR